MLCQKCHQREASVHVMQILNGMMRELHLCGDCATKQFTPDMLTGKQLMELFGQSQSVPDLACPVCGVTLSDFQRTGYVGCPQCYEVFRAQMEPMLMAVHGATRHVSRAAQGPVEMHQSDVCASLREQLRQAVQEERYEQAAVLRDQLRKAEQEING